jgi:hypothetical protein
MVRVVDDVEVGTDEVNDPAARPQAGAVAGRFRSGHHEARQSLPLGGGQLGRSTGGRPGTEPDAALSSVRPLPSTDRPPIDAEAVSHHMNGDVTLKELDRVESSPLELSRAPLWAHVAPPTGEHSRIGHYLGRNH